MNEVIYNLLTKPYLDEENKALLDEAIELESKIREFNEKICMCKNKYHDSQIVYSRYGRVEDYFLFVKNYVICDKLL